MDSRQQNDISLTSVQKTTWLLLICMAGAGYFFHSWSLALSICIGGLLANFSFSRLKGDLLHLFEGPLEAVKVRFFLKYYLRLTVVAVLLFFLIKSGKVNTVGLLIGLSTVFLSIVLNVTGVTKRFFFSAKEAL